MVKMKHYEKINYDHKFDYDNPNEELAFILWKAELNKELLGFWKLINK